MSAPAQADQVAAQAAQVEQEYRHEEKRERKAMDSKILAPKFNANPRVSDQAFSKAIDDDKRSVASGQPVNPLSPAFFFESTTAKSAAEIGEAAVKLSEHEKSNVEEHHCPSPCRCGPEIVRYSRN